LMFTENKLKNDENAAFEGFNGLHQRPT